MFIWRECSISFCVLIGVFDMWVISGSAVFLYFSVGYGLE
tara:strand:+ start:44 stop:163 length:120 start_codon:yes stop_codon:yes gene_type:complete